MISLDLSILYQIILFVALWLILNKILFQPYLQLLEERERRTIGAEHDSADLEHEGARLRAQYEGKIAQAQSAAAASPREATGAPIAPSAAIVLSMPARMRLPCTLT